MKRQLRLYAPTAIAIAALVALAAAVGGYVLVHQRLTFPWQDRYTIQAAFETAQAVSPGQGQQVTVAGVQVGVISGVRLNDGRAIVSMSIDAHKLPAVYANAHMLLRPRTQLQDMTVELDPGDARAPRLRSDDVLSVADTQPNVNLDQVLAGLDSDTRNYLQILIDSSGRGLAHRGLDLRRLLGASRPALASVHRLTSALAARHTELGRLVHNLQLLSSQVAVHDAALGRLIAASDETFATLGGQEAALRASLARLPGTLRTAGATLADLRPFAAAAQPALTALAPTAHRLAPAVKSLHPLFMEGTQPLIQLDSFSRTTAPVAANLVPATADLKATTPSLIGAFRVLGHVTNELAYVPPAPDHSYLFWLAWFAHNGNSFLSTQDAHGAAWRGEVMVSCSDLASVTGSSPLAALYQTGGCPTAPR